MQVTKDSVSFLKYISTVMKMRVGAKRGSEL
jgi:hypothetical protein